MKRIDFENGTVTGNILGAALPMLVAQILNLLYNIVDRIYIARIPEVGTAALGAVGLCFPLIVVITAFANLFGSGGAPLFSIYRGKKKNREAEQIMDTSFSMVCVSGLILMAIGLLFARPVLILFGASDSALTYAYPYLMIYLLGTFPSIRFRKSAPAAPALPTLSAWEPPVLSCSLPTAWSASAATVCSLSQAEISTSLL